MRPRPGPAAGSGPSAENSTWTIWMVGRRPWWSAISPRRILQAKVLWSGKPVHEAVTPPVILDGHLYGLWTDVRQEAWELSGNPSQANFSFRCTDLKRGKLQWLQPGFHMGLSMSAADGHIYLRSHQTVTLVEARSERVCGARADREGT